MDFSDDYAYAAKLAVIRWPDGMPCARPGCPARKHWQHHTRPRVFTCTACNQQRSVTAGCSLHRSRIPLRIWFIADELLQRPEGLAAAELARRESMRYGTAHSALARLRSHLEQDGVQLTGPVGAETTLAPTKTPRHQRRWHPDGTPIWAFVGADHNTVSAVGDLEPAAQRGHCAPHLGGVWKLLRGERLACTTVRHAASVIGTTHTGVTERWMPTYLQAICWVRNRRGSPLRVAMGTPARAFAELRPREPD